jgi:hypothetical protein
MFRRMSLITVFTSLIIFISACGSTAASETPALTEAVTSPTTAQTSSPSEAPTEAPTEVQPTALPAHPFSPALGGDLTVNSNEFFAAAGNCVVCHQGILDAAGNDVSNGDYWRSTMMANAAKDPYFLAGVSMNVDTYPEYTNRIEAICSTCHMPMAHFSDAATRNPKTVSVSPVMIQPRKHGENLMGDTCDTCHSIENIMFGAGSFTDFNNPLNILSQDGVSCTVCHQIQDEGLGETSSFSGNPVFDMETPMGERELFGRWVPDQSGIMSMSKISGFVPTQGEHLIESDLCAVCHNLYTNYILKDDTISDELFPEQTMYSEWLNSDLATQSSCQDCHMPPADGEISIATTGSGILRSPYARHTFVGGNAYMLDILKNFGGESGVQADEAQFDDTIERTLAQLQSAAAELTVSKPVLSGSTLNFDITINTLTGHKFPSGFPSRRAWIQVRVKDSAGKVVFTSGDVNPDGSIIGNDNDTDPLMFEPHYDQITSPDQVQIYENIMGNVDGQVTTVLLAASSYLKDNRLLPAGFDKTNVPADIAPDDLALADDDFIGGSDTVSYRLDLGGASGPFTVEVSLLYQSIASRWAQNVSKVDTDQAQLFSSYYNTLPNTPVMVASLTAKSK